MYTIAIEESVNLNYQDIKYGHNDSTEIGIVYNGVCDQLIVESFTEQDILQERNSEYPPIKSGIKEPITVDIPQGRFTQTENGPVYIRIVVGDDDDKICSDDQSQQTCYHFVTDGKLYKELASVA